MRQNIKQFIEAIIMALVIMIPVLVMVYGMYINNSDVASIGYMSVFPWIILVLWIEDKINEHFNRY